LYQIERASSRYRVFQFLQPLKRSGLQCTVIEAPQGDLRRRLTYLPRLVHLARNHDVVYVQKRTFPRFVLWLLCQLNPHIVFDLDDAVFLRPDRRPLIDLALRSAVAVVAGNEYLATYARRFNDQVIVIPTVVDTERYLPPSGPRHPGDDRVVVGWIGSDPNRGDLAPMHPVFDWLGERYGGRVVFRTVGRCPLVMDTALDLEFVPWTLEGSLSALQEFDIGVMPLEDSEWSRGKCGFKLIQYMAVGAATVASPVGVNQDIVRDGDTGYLAADTGEWQRRLACLIENEALRRSMGRAARLRVERLYSTTALLPRLTEVLECASGGQQVRGAETDCIQG
jgi:glycosyltransferase involved in cell wall biosynthesis